MRVDAGQVGRDQRLPHSVGIRLAGAGCHEDVLDQGVQVFGGDVRHFSSF